MANQDTPRKRKPGPRIKSPGWLVVNRPRQGKITLRFRYTGENGRKEVWLGHIYISNTPILDSVLRNTDRLTVDELIRMRDCDKSCGRIWPVKPL